MTQTEEQVKLVMSVVLGIPTSEITAEATQDNYPTWDSLKHLDLVVALEEEFGISIQEEEIGNMLSLKLIAIIVQECLDA